jgi:hypothetical protein
MKLRVLVISKTELKCSVSQFPHLCTVSASDLYWSAYFVAAKQGDRSLEYINRSQIHACWNWKRGRAVSFLEILKSDFRYSVYRCTCMCFLSCLMRHPLRHVTFWIHGSFLISPGLPLIRKMGRAGRPFPTISHQPPSCGCYITILPLRILFLFSCSSLLQLKPRKKDTHTEQEKLYVWFPLTAGEMFRSQEHKVWRLLPKWYLWLPLQSRDSLQP